MESKQGRTPFFEKKVAKKRLLRFARWWPVAGLQGAKRSKSFLVTPGGAPFFQKSNHFS
jgi:hypothetical protein